MKKLLILILSIGLIFSGLGVNATGASEFSAEMNYDKENNRYIISGTVAGDMGNVPMTLSVLKSNGDFYTGLQTLAKRNGEKIEFKFDALNFPTDAATDTYTLCVSSEFFTQTQTFSLPIFSVEDQFGFLKAVNGYIENGGAGICTSAKANAEYLGLSETDFQLGEEAVEVFDTFITSPYDIPAEFNSGKLVNSSDINLYGIKLNTEERVVGHTNIVYGGNFYSYTVEDKTRTPGANYQLYDNENPYVNDMWNGTVLEYTSVTIEYDTDELAINYCTAAPYHGQTMEIRLGSPDSEPIAELVTQDIGWGVWDKETIVPLNKTVKSGVYNLYVTFKDEGNRSCNLYYLRFVDPNAAPVQLKELPQRVG